MSRGTWRDAVGAAAALAAAVVGGTLLRPTPMAMPLAGPEDEDQTCPEAA